MTIGLLVFACVLILIGAELFTNGVEWLGQRLGLSEGAVGSVLAAVGTALPETMIPLGAILFGVGAGADAIGVGAILGAPFMLATLAMFVTGIAVVARARSRPQAGPGEESTADLLAVDTRVIAHDVKVFALIYVVAIAVAFLPAGLAAPRWLAALVLIGLYIRYVAAHLGAKASVSAELPGPLRLRRLDPGSAGQLVPRAGIVAFQVVIALAAIIAGAVVFVSQVEVIAHAIGLDEMLLSLVVAPIATELPEKLNSVIWIGRGKDTLALDNITGAMVFEAAIPTSIALLFASSQWSIESGSWVAFASAVVAIASTAVIFGPMVRTGRLHGRGLLVGGAFYLAQLILIVASLGDLVAA